jgi:hypothetical protein
LQGLVIEGSRDLAMGFCLMTRRNVLVLRIRHVRKVERLASARSTVAVSLFYSTACLFTRVKGSELNVGDLSTGGNIGLMPDEHLTAIRIAGE